MPKVLEVGVPRGTAACGGVIMHGRGGTAEEMTALAGRLAAPGIRWVVPEAEGGRWFPHRFMGPRSRNEPFLSEAVASCEQLVNDASDGGRIAPEQLAVVGFSQGACLASEFILRRPRRCRAVVMFTGGLIGPDDTPWAVSDGSLAGVSVLITGSDTDACGCPRNGYGVPHRCWRRWAPRWSCASTVVVTTSSATRSSLLPARFSKEP